LLNECEQWWNDTDRGKMKHLEKNTYSLGGRSWNDSGAMV